MLETAYKAYITVFGHTSMINKIVNKYSENTKKIDPSSHISRGNELYGNISISEKVGVKNSGTFIHGNISIGRYTDLNGDNELVGDITIGQFCALAPRARIRTKDHIQYKPSLHGKLYDSIGINLNSTSKGPVKVGNDVWIGSDVKILSGVEIGDGAVIGADSVVVSDVDSYSVVAGVPAKHKHYRFDKKTRDSLLKLQWWNWDMDKIMENKEFFDTDLREIDDIQEMVVE
jgi:virginiamycin A acetyltransferase